MIINLEEKLKGTIPIDRNELIDLINSWGRTDSFSIMNYKQTMISYSAPNMCYDLSNLLHTSKHSFGISFLDSKNSYNKQLLYFTKLALICKQIIFNFYFYLVSQIEDLSDLFCYTMYNGDLSKWDVSNCTNMNYTFSNNRFFDNDSICNWNTSYVQILSSCFANSVFNQDLSKWDVSNVKNFSYIFYNAEFNNDISSWNIKKGVNFESAFNSGYFDGDISKWAFQSKIFCNSMFEFNENFLNKYNDGKELPNNTQKFLEWFEANKNKISNLNVTKKELVDIDDYLSIFDEKELKNDKS